MITLVIIGVIAALTVPTLINKTQNQEYVSRLKKAYSTLSQMAYNVTLNSGYTSNDYSMFTDINKFTTEFKKIVNVSRECTSAECFGNEYFSNYKRLNNNGMGTDFFTDTNFVTADGQMFAFYINFSNPPSAPGMLSSDRPNIIGRIIVDVNGKKKPNKFGRDTFIFYLMNKKGIVPAGTGDMSDCNISSTGYSCAAKVLKEGAMNY